MRPSSASTRSIPKSLQEDGAALGRDGDGRPFRLPAELELEEDGAQRRVAAGLRGDEPVEPAQQGLPPRRPRGGVPTRPSPSNRAKASPATCRASSLAAASSRGGQAPRSTRARTKVSRTAWSSAPSSRGSMSRSPRPASRIPDFRSRYLKGQAAWVSSSVGLHCSGRASRQAARPGGIWPAAGDARSASQDSRRSLSCRPLSAASAARAARSGSEASAARARPGRPSPASRAAPRSASASPRASSRAGFHCE